MASIKDLMSNEDLVVGIVEATTPAELGEVLKRNNIQLEDGMTLEEAFQAMKAENNGEITEEALDDVSGGALLTAMIGATIYLCGGTAMLSALYGCAKAEYKKYRGK